jgi:hypothetical protein
MIDTGVPPKIAEKAIWKAYRYFDKLKAFD